MRRTLLVTLALALTGCTGILATAPKPPKPREPTEVRTMEADGSCWIEYISAPAGGYVVHTIVHYDACPDTTRAGR